ncbi:MAG: BrnA antitoxin family protein [Beijerinckiaceae bacterium]
MPRTPRKPDHISQADWDAVDSPELSSEFIARMRPVREVAPELIAFQRLLEKKRGRPKAETTKQLHSIRLSSEVVEHFKAGGAGWQTRIDEALLALVHKGRAAPKKAATKKAPVKKTAAKKAARSIRPAGRVSGTKNARKHA